MNLIVSYLRYSDHKQDDGFSIEYQTTEVNEFAERNGLAIDHYYIDKAQTATKIAGREEFFALVNDVKAGKIKVVIVYKLSRMFRNMLESSKYRDMFRKHGVKIMAVTQSVDEETSSGRLQTNILSSIDQYQSETISDHVKSSMREMARQGFYTGGTVRFGFDLKEVPHGKKKRKVFIEHPKEAEIVKQIFAMYVDGMSVGMIRNHLNTIGETTRQGKPFTASYVARIIADDMYMGVYRYKTKGYDDLVIENVLPVLVDKAIWITANDIKDGKQKNELPQPRKTNRFYALTGKLKCGKCGGHFIGFSAVKNRNNEKREYLYYVCKNQKAYKKHKGKFILKEFLENATLNAIKSLILSDEKIKEISAMVVEMCQNSPSDLDDKIKENISKKSTLEKNIEKIVDLFLSGSVASEILKVKMAEMEKELKQVERLIFSLKEQQKNIITQDKVEQYMRTLFEKSCSGNDEELKVVFDTFVNEIEIFDDEVKISLNAFVDKFSPSHEETPLIPCGQRVSR